MESWSINTTEWVGYSAQYPNGLKLISLVPHRGYRCYWDAYGDALELATMLQRPCYLGSAVPYQVVVYPRHMESV